MTDADRGRPLDPLCGLGRVPVSAALEQPRLHPEISHDYAGLTGYGVPVRGDDGGLAAWLESKRLLVSPERHIDTLRHLLTEDDDPLLVCDYDLISDPQAVAIVEAQQRAAGQRHRRPRRLAARKRSAK